VHTLIEGPAAVVLGAASSALATAALPADVVARRTQVALDYSALIADGSWNTPTRATLDAFADTCADALTGTVTLQLAAGQCRVLDCAVTTAGTPAVAYS
jgi:argininosuccinate synthase